jgi:hypothetical protein
MAASLVVVGRVASRLGPATVCFFRSKYIVNLAQLQSLTPIKIVQSAKQASHAARGVAEMAGVCGISVQE